MESASSKRLSALAATQAFVVAENGEIDLQQTNLEINKMHQDGWDLVTVSEGVAFWKMDFNSISELLEDEHTCGKCVHFDGNLCDVTGYSIGADSKPDTDSCFEGITP